MFAGMVSITPHLWFDDNAQEAAQFYVAVFPNSRILGVQRYTDAGPGEPGAVVTVDFELDGVRFVGINGGPHVTFSEAVSFAIETDDQAQTDRYWQALTADGGAESHCGWLTDKFGLSWQVYPRELQALLDDPDPGRAARANAEMLTMRRIDIDAVRRAADDEDRQVTRLHLG